MKNIIYLILILFILFILSSCSSEDKNNHDKNNSKSDYSSGKNQLYGAREIYLSFLKNKNKISDNQIILLDNKTNFEKLNEMPNEFDKHKFINNLINSDRKKLQKK